jgi:hypothetical protein
MAYYRQEPDRTYTITPEVKEAAIPCSASFCLLAVAERMKSGSSHLSVGRSFIAWRENGRHYRASVEDNQDFINRVAEPFDQGYDVKVGTTFTIAGIQSRVIQKADKDSALRNARYRAEIKAGNRSVQQRKKASPRVNKRWGIVA